jgi:hypothetical protein
MTDSDILRFLRAKQGSAEKAMQMVVVGGGMR